MVSEFIFPHLRGFNHQPQHEFPSCTGGHFTVPYEQNTQQSPLSGLNSVLHDSHS